MAVKKGPTFGPPEGLVLDGREHVPSGPDYALTIPYEDGNELDETINDIIQDAANTADLRHCFIECEVTVMDGSERRW